MRISDWSSDVCSSDLLKPEELTDPATSLETLAWRLFHEDEVRIEPGLAISRGCRCSADYYAGVLSKFPEAERRDKAEGAGLIQIARSEERRVGQGWVSTWRARWVQVC